MVSLNLIITVFLSLFVIGFFLNLVLDLLVSPEWLERYSIKIKTPKPSKYKYKKNVIYKLEPEMTIEDLKSPYTDFPGGNINCYISRHELKYSTDLLVSIIFSFVLWPVHVLKYGYVETDCVEVGSLQSVLTEVEHSDKSLESIFKKVTERIETNKAMVTSYENFLKARINNANSDYYDNY